MQTDKDQLEALWNKWLANEISGEELDRLLDAVERRGDDAETWQFIQEGFRAEAAATPVGMDEEQKQQLWQNFQAMRITEAPAPVRRIIAWRRWAGAAAVLLALTGGVLLWKQQQKPEGNGGAVLASSEIVPGKSGAILTLADGREVVLDSAGKGVIATQNGARVVLKDGQVDYEVTGNTGGAAVFNTMRTPRGRQFQLVLPDGSRVWLNSASNLRYPTVFSDSERRVEVTGEAYFEITQNAKAPFRVSVAGKAAVEVLGTQFNVNAYDNEKALRATLLEGSIRVKEIAGTKPRSVVLKPGQQAAIGVTGQGNAAAGIMVYSGVDVSKVTAWKNGLFNFDGLSLQEAMQQLERWYDIEVVYENGIPEIPFEGEMSRNISLDGLLKMLEAADLHFRIEKGRKLIITNK